MANIIPMSDPKSPPQPAQTRVDSSAQADTAASTQRTYKGDAAEGAVTEAALWTSPGTRIRAPYAAISAAPTGLRDTPDPSFYKRQMRAARGGRHGARLRRSGLAVAARVPVFAIGGTVARRRRGNVKQRRGQDSQHRKEKREFGHLGSSDRAVDDHCNGRSFKMCFTPPPLAVS